MKNAFQIVEELCRQIPQSAGFGVYLLKKIPGVHPLGSTRAARSGRAKLNMFTPPPPTAKGWTRACIFPLVSSIWVHQEHPTWFFHIYNRSYKSLKYLIFDSNTSTTILDRL